MLLVLIVATAALFSSYWVLICRQTGLYYHLFCADESTHESAHTVGVSSFVVPETGSHFRVFYPAAAVSSASTAYKAVLTFENGVAFVLAGYLHVFGGGIFGRCCRSGSQIFVLFMALFIRPIGFLADILAGLGLGGILTVPLAFHDAPPVSGRYPIVVFSHGLTGTSEEHGILFAAWARRGFVVVAIHHTDGSSSLAPVEGKDGKLLFYEHPRYKPAYDSNFRPGQVQRRADELEAMETYALHSLDFAVGTGRPIRSIMDTSRVVLGGFSYGAATAALVAARTGTAGMGAPRHHEYCGIMLLDGWFNLDLKNIQSCARNDQVAFPALAHRVGIAPRALFVGSEQFDGYLHLKRRTKELAACCHGGAECHTLPGTKHWNFCDLPLWMPRPFLPLLSFVGALGPGDAHEAYGHLFDLTADFMSRVTGDSGRGSTTTGGVVLAACAKAEGDTA